MCVRESERERINKEKGPHKEVKCRGPNDNLGYWGHLVDPHIAKKFFVCLWARTKCPHNNRTLRHIGVSCLSSLRKNVCVGVTVEDRKLNVPIIKGMHDDLVYWGHSVSLNKEKKLCVCAHMFYRVFLAKGNYLHPEWLYNQRCGSLTVRCVTERQRQEECEV